MLNRLYALLRRPLPQVPSGPPVAANENIPILGPGADPAEELAIVRFLLARMRRHNARHGTLLACPQRRQHYEEARALERAIVWWYFRER
jgi:hypothetical protein